MGSALKIGTVLLAAGSASRMGHRPKCLLELEGEPLIRRQLRALLDAGVDEVVVVLGHYADRIEAVIPDFRSNAFETLTPMLDKSRLCASVCNCSQRRSIQSSWPWPISL